MQIIMQIKGEVVGMRIRNVNDLDKTRDPEDMLL